MPDSININDPRLGISSQKLLHTLYTAGINVPGRYTCGKDSEHSSITWAFATQNRELRGPHPGDTWPRQPYAPTHLLGNRVFRISRCEPTDPWRASFDIDLLVFLHDPTVKKTDEKAVKAEKNSEKKPVATEPIQEPPDDFDDWELA